jgi:hypothetical protein
VCTPLHTAQAYVRCSGPGDPRGDRNFSPAMKVEPSAVAAEAAAFVRVYYYTSMGVRRAGRISSLVSAI